MTKWVTISEASVILGMSERTIWRRVAEGKLEAKLDGNRRFIKLEGDNDSDVIAGMPMADKDSLIRWLKNELEVRNEEIKRLQEEIKQNRERSDAIIMKLTDELEAQRRFTEGNQPRRKQDESFWRRIGRKETQK